ncbi:hypothetical protein ACZ90_52465 [Streptomyces albus subsp. albus]|nr:hypothetical protein ACZ90_52465 [Streptomyces albus subsp. albus]
MTENLDDVLDDPGRLLDADRAAVRTRITASAAGSGVGREVFQQAEAVFGGAEVSRPEFASWLHFAAVVLGHHGYAERIAAAEPGMPWRAVWTWWRPVGQCVAHPNLGSSGSARRHLHQGRELVHVHSSWEDGWLDLETGAPLPAPEAGSAVPVERDHGSQPELDLFHRQLSAPESWGSAETGTGPDGAIRHLVTDVHGVALLTSDPAVLREWPRGRLDGGSALAGSPGDTPLAPEPDGPLTAARLDAAFAPVAVRRIPEERLPAALEHPAARAHLRDIGLPSWWGCAWTTFEPREAEEMTAPSEEDLDGAELPDGLTAGDLLALGSCEHGELYLHRRDGTVHIHADGTVLGTPADEVVPLAPDLDVLTRGLEGVRRYMNACWHPYPGEEDMGGIFLMELDGLAPGLLDPDNPGGRIWEHLVAGITELGEDGF